VLTQVTHTLLHHLDLHGLLQALVPWFAVWLGWLTTGVMLGVCVWEAHALIRRRRA